MTASTVTVSLFVAGAIFGDVGVSVLVASALFGDVGLLESMTFRVQNHWFHVENGVVFER